jgi:hypothetical protein
VRSLLEPKLAVPLVLYFAWLGGTVWVGQQVGIWELAMTKATVVWVVASGIALYFGVSKALSSKGFFKSALARSLGISVFVEWLVNMQSFPLIVEVLVQLLALLCVGVGAVARRDPTHEKVAKLANSVLVGIGLASLMWAGWHLVAQRSGVDWPLQGRELLLPFWLTPSALVFVYLLTMFAGFELAFMRIGLKAGQRRTWQLKAAYVSAVGLRLGRMRELNGALQLHVGQQASFREARQILVAATRRGVREKSAGG